MFDLIRSSTEFRHANHLASRRILAAIVIGALGLPTWQACGTTPPADRTPKRVVLGCEDSVRHLALEAYITDKSVTIVHFIEDAVSGSPPHSGTVTTSEHGYMIALRGGGECRMNIHDGRFECIDRERAYWFQGWCRQGAPLF